MRNELRQKTTNVMYFILDQSLLCLADCYIKKQTNKQTEIFILTYWQESRYQNQTAKLAFSSKDKFAL